jgi:hypothetical protein
LESHLHPRSHNKSTNFGVTPLTPCHTINQTLYRTISMTKYADKWLQFLTPTVSVIRILGLRKRTQN